MKNSVTMFCIFSIKEWHLKIQKKEKNGAIYNFVLQKGYPLQVKKFT